MTGRRDEELEELLRSAAAPSPRPEFERDLRKRFVAGEGSEARSEPGAEGPVGGPFAAPESGSRTDRRARTSSTVPDRLEDALSSSALAPPARPDFRDELRERFVSGALADDPPRLAGGPATPPRGWLIPLGAWVAAAAAVLLLVVLWPRSAASSAWDVVAWEGAGPVLVDGRPVDRADFPARWSVPSGAAEGPRLETGDRSLQLALGERLVIEVRPHTELVPVALAADEVALRLDSGEVYLMTGAEHRGRVLVSTPESEVVVTGTTLGVLADAVGGTCVCVVEGEVEVHSDGLEERVPAGCGHSVPKEGTPSTMPFAQMLEGENPDHVANLQRFYESH